MQNVKIITFRSQNHSSDPKNTPTLSYLQRRVNIEVCGRCDLRSDDRVRRGAQQTLRIRHLQCMPSIGSPGCDRRGQQEPVVDEHTTIARRQRAHPIGFSLWLSAVSETNTDDRVHAESNMMNASANWHETQINHQSTQTCKSHH